MNGPWRDGNQFLLLENGEAYFPRVIDVIREARSEILIETFILFDDKVGQALRQALMQAAGFEELEHYYRPTGLPREQQPWLASVWRQVTA